MKKVLYRFRKECTKPQISYGVELLEDGVCTGYISNVFTEKKYAKKLVHDCNKYDVAPIHLPDVIEDMCWDIRHACV